VLRLFINSSLVVGKGTQPSKLPRALLTMLLVNQPQLPTRSECSVSNGNSHTNSRHG
jgi:hypothetical protein